MTTRARTSITPRESASRGRIDKRHAILDAAFTVFSRKGYSQACVNEIAAEAGVAKPTVYNHLDSKENLFRHAMTTAAEGAMARNLAAIERLRDADGDLRGPLEELGLRLLQCYSNDQSWALRRLLYAEVTQFPDLLDIVLGNGTNRLAEALADRFARLALTGRLRPADPAAAAEQFLALLTGPVDIRSRLGTRRMKETELRQVAGAAVATFLLAFSAEGSRSAVAQEI
ncbi:TetR/AcrR family transcriptional regulator [Streptomyces griseocarneus]|uniref:TetR/AcrR family transcriptional regulator n=1 Tax=Streptomyces griseocarneus TaxID=51201 RepID=UPI00167EEA6C|nr:TetR/AcrR family transcriptional regulator [Streptomyces griseocarneus]MBZ6477617.1 TetR/AcrR family transcriptional regulator [Streptomyces griseocarneus]GHG83279.1 TetR family transcriptional regulator [Streptomyces griseocarneus]